MLTNHGQQSLHPGWRGGTALVLIALASAPYIRYSTGVLFKWGAHLPPTSPSPPRHPVESRCTAWYMQSGQNILLYFYRSIIHGRASENHTFSDHRVFRHTCQMVFRSKKSVSNTYLKINMGKEIKKGKSSVNMGSQKV